MSELTGVIEQDGLTFPFYADDFRFHILPSDYEYVSKDLPGIRLFNTEPDYLLKPVNGFLRGYLYNQREILIFCGGDIAMRPTATFRTWLYIVGESFKHIDTFDVLSFHGKSLNSVFRQNALDIPDTKPDTINIAVSKDEFIVPIDEDGIDKFRFYSGFEWKQTPTDGLKLTSSGAYLDIYFKESQEVNDKIQRYHTNIRTMLQFLTFRKNVGFETASFKQFKTQSNEKKLVTIAQCYIREDDNEIEVRNGQHCINVNHLAPIITGNLYRFINSMDAKNPQYCIEFIPRSNQAFNWLTNDQLRDVCTSMELEAGLSNINPTDDSDFKAVVKQVSDLVNEKYEDGKLTKRQRDYITGNISHWSGPAAELDKKLYDANKDNLSYIQTVHHVTDLTEDDIQQVIKIRNTLTHGRSDVRAITDQKCVHIVCILIAVIYSSVLRCCGCDDKTIRNISLEAY